MLETIQNFNSWIWNLIGLVIGIPILTTMVVSVFVSIVALISTLFYRFSK